MNKLLEFEGKDQLVEAVETIASDKPPDLVVVRDFLTDSELLRRLVLESHDLSEPVSPEEFHSAVPQLQEATDIIRERWAQVGYPEVPVVEDLELDTVVENGSVPHLDEIRSGNFEAIAQASLCLHGKRIFGAEVLPVTFRLPDGRFDADRFDSFNAIQTVKKGLQPRTKAEVGKGDLVLFPHHPNITLHGVEHTEGQHSIARLLTWYATRDYRGYGNE